MFSRRPDRRQGSTKDQPPFQIMGARRICKIKSDRTLMLLQIIKIVCGCLDCENQMVFEDLSDVLRRRSVGSSSAFCPVL